MTETTTDGRLPTAPPSPGPLPKAPAAKSKVFSKYQLPSDRTPFVTHFDILGRFVTQSRNGTEPVSADKVEGEGIPIQAAQMNVKFLTGLGLLKFESKGLYTPTPETIRFVNARTVDDDRARPILRSLVDRTWFAEIALGLLRTRPVVTDDALIGELALAAQTNREKKGPALRVLVEYLVWSGVIHRDERGLSQGDARSDAELPSDPVPSESASPPSIAGSKQGDRYAGASDSLHGEGATWHIIQTEDYFLKVRSDLDVIEDVREQLALLTRKIERLRTRSSVPPLGEREQHEPTRA